MKTSLLIASLALSSNAIMLRLPDEGLSEYIHDSMKNGEEDDVSLESEYMKRDIKDALLV